MRSAAASCRSARREQAAGAHDLGRSTASNTASTPSRFTPIAIQPGARVLLIDDLIATGGTAEAAIKLIRRSGGDIVAAAFVIDLPDLGGAARIAARDVNVHTLVSFEGH